MPPPMVQCGSFPRAHHVARFWVNLGRFSPAWAPYPYCRWCAMPKHKALMIYLIWVIPIPVNTGDIVLSAGRHAAAAAAL